MVHCLRTLGEGKGTHGMLAQGSATNGPDTRKKPSETHRITTAGALRAPAGVTQSMDFRRFFVHVWAICGTALGQHTMGAFSFPQGMQAVPSISYLGQWVVDTPLLLIASSCY